MPTMSWFRGAAGRRARMVLWGALALCIVSAGSARVAAEERGQKDSDKPNPALYEKDARPFGQKLESLAEDWWRWA
jgi:hypothetical protein